MTINIWLFCGVNYWVSEHLALLQFIAHQQNVCGEWFRLAQSGRRVRSVTVFIDKVRIRSPTLDE